MNTYWRYRDLEVPFPFVVTDENGDAVANVVRGQYQLHHEGRTVGTENQLTLLTDRADFGYERVNGGDYGDWHQISREDFRHLLKKQGFKKCIGRL